MIFSRREIQERLNQLRKHLHPDEIDSFAKRLNKVGRSRISAMWEVMIISSLLRLGRVEVESQLCSGRRPDIFFDDGNGTSFYADITCVSDEGVDRENPVNFFSQQLMEVVAKLRLPRAGHNVRIESKVISSIRGQKTVLRLPPHSEIPKFISERIEPALKIQSKSGERYIRILIDDEQACVSLTIDTVGGEFNSYSYASYDQPSIVDRNPLFNALRSKSRQLKTAEGVKGIIVCDGDSQALTSKSAHHVDDAFLICREFFRQHSSIDFIFIISVSESRNNLLNFRDVHRAVSAKLDFRKGFLRGNEIKLVLDSVFKDFPKPINSPVNAVHRARESGYGCGHRGGYRMSDNKVRLSSKAIMEVLSGKKSIDEFNADYGWNDNSDGFRRNPFEGYLMSGRLPVRITVEASDDDDWIEFEFGGRDAAVSEFH